MQPQRATRGIAAVALSSAACGVLLVLLALLLTACGAASNGTPVAATSTSPSAASSPTAPSSASSAAASPSAGAGTPASALTSPTPAPATSTPFEDQTVPSVPVTTAPPVPLSAAAPVAGGGSVTIGTITSIQGTARLPGETAGPAVQVPVTIVNGTGAAIDLSQVVVDLVDSAGVSAGQLSASPSAPFDGTLAARATARGVYVFSLATDDRRGVRIIVSYTTAAPVVVFTGTIA